MNKQIDVININEEETEFLEESNYIEREYSKEALQDAKQSWMMAKICANEPLFIDYILAIHRRLMKKLNPRIAGKIRDCRVFVGNRECMDKLQIKKTLINWCEKYKKPKNWEEIKQAHIKFEEIHPFEDGNGRTGRILMNIQRLKLGLPVLIIYNKNKFDYYKWFGNIN